MLINNRYYRRGYEVDYLALIVFLVIEHEFEHELEFFFFFAK